MNVSRKQKLIFVICVFAYFAAIMLASPYLSDDIEFASKNFKTLEDIINYSLYYGNGRLLGNIGIHILLKNKILGAVICAFTVTGIIYLMPLVIKADHFISYWFSLLLTIGMAPKLFSEVYAWKSGFQNYTPPIFTTLLISYLILYAKSKSLFRSLAIFVLGVITQLYVEHISIFTIVLSLGLAIYSLKTKDYLKLFLSAIWSASSLIGGIAMAAIPRIFYKEVNRTTGYRGICLGFELIKSICRNSIYLGTYLVENNILFLSIIIGALYLLKRYEITHKEIVKRFLYISIIFYFIDLCSIRNSRYIWAAYLWLAMKVIMALFSVGVLFYSLYKIGREVKTSAILLSLAVISILPLLIVYPVSRRVVHISYILLCLLFLNCFDKLLLEEKKHTQALSSCIPTVTVILSIGVLVLFINAKADEKLRDKFIALQMQEHKIEIQVFDFPEEYIFDDNDTAMLGYKYYYEKPLDISFSAIGYNEWIEVYYPELTIIR